MRCRKRKYPDAIAAKLALANARRKDGSRRTKLEQRAYRCECGSWHLTAQSDRKETP